MSLGVQLFSRPLRHCIISHTEHKQLFQNIEKLVTISEYHLSQMTATLQPGSSYKPRVSIFWRISISEDELFNVKGNSNDLQWNQSWLILISLLQVSLLCDAYVSYIGELRQALELLHQLVAYPEFKQFLASAEAKLPAFSIEAFLERPVQVSQLTQTYFMDRYENDFRVEFTYHCFFIMIFNENLLLLSALQALKWQSRCCSGFNF